MNIVALICTAALGLLLFGLGFAISATRFRAGTLTGYAPQPDCLLNRLVRAHGNTAEFAPFLAVLFLYLGAHEPAPWQIGLMVAAAVCRILVVVGLLAWPTMTQPNPVRFIGALGTYIFGLALCLSLFASV